MSLTIGLSNLRLRQRSGDAIYTRMALDKVTFTYRRGSVTVAP